MRNLILCPMTFLISFLIFASCTESPPATVELSADRTLVEVGGTVALSLRISTPEDEWPQLSWESGGRIIPTPVVGEVDLQAPDQPGPITVKVTVVLESGNISREITIDVQPRGSLKRTADILITVDTNTLKNVWVTEDHPAENFTPPLKIKGTFRFNPDSGEAWAGGSWPEFTMSDNGDRGDAVAEDGVWSLLMRFEKTDAKIYFAFDDASSYRVQWESGLAWRLKSAWIELDEFPGDNSNPAFIPDADKIVAWTSDMARAGRIHESIE